MEAQRLRRRYDHRFQRHVHDTGDLQLAIRHGVPRSTARDWSRRSTKDVVSVDVFSKTEAELREEVRALRARNAKLIAILRLVIVLLRVYDVTLLRRRVANGEKKRRILQAVKRSRSVLQLRLALRILGLSTTRYHAWKRDEECELDDVSSCPQSRPQQLTAEERETIKEIVHSKEYRHVPTGTLAILAQRLGKVFASPSTWHRLVHRHCWRRPRKRVHPPRPRIGIRAAAPNEIWHIDTTSIRLLDGTRAYLYAVIDNFSRKILSWRLSEHFDPTKTLEVLVEAARPLVDADHPPTFGSATQAHRFLCERAQHSAASLCVSGPDPGRDVSWERRRRAQRTRREEESSSRRAPDGKQIYVLWSLRARGYGLTTKNSIRHNDSCPTDRNNPGERVFGPKTVWHQRRNTDWPLA